MEIAIAGAVIVVIILVLWTVSCRHRLVAMDENVNNATAQIGVQLSFRCNALAALLDVAKGYAPQEAQTLIETVKSRRSVITAGSTPDEVLKQEAVIAQVLEHVAEMVKQYPELKDDGDYAERMSAVDSCERMVHTSRLIYNDNVTRLNRELRTFPACLVAGIFGVRQRDYLEAAEDRADPRSIW